MTILELFSYEFSDGRKDTAQLNNSITEQNVNRTKCSVIKVNRAKLEIAPKWSNDDQITKFLGLNLLKLNCLQIAFNTFY